MGERIGVFANGIDTTTKGIALYKDLRLKSWRNSKQLFTGLQADVLSAMSLRCFNVKKFEKCYERIVLKKLISSCSIVHYLR